MRICSLLPSATEIVFSLGMGHSLVGVTHECDYPPEASYIPKVTRSNIPPGISSAGIDAAVSSTLGTSGSLYELDIPLLERLQPDLILTQRLCDDCGGHWMKELVEIAGGRDDLSNLHKPSYRIEWHRVLEFRPQVIVLTCCGFGLERVRQEGEILATFEGFDDLPAARAGRVFATDGSSYFSRPGPRIVESQEILAHLIHPELFPPPPLPGAFSALDLSPVRDSKTTASTHRS